MPADTERTGDTRARPADDALIAAVTANPRDGAALDALLARLGAGRRYDEAEHWARRAVRYAPRSAEAHGRLAGVLVRVRPAAAAWHLRRALALAAARPPAWLAALATCLQATGELDEARALLREVAATAPSAATALRLAALEERGGRLDAAAAALASAEALSPSEAESCQAMLLRAILQERGRELEAALATLDDVARRPGSTRAPSSPVESVPVPVSTSAGLRRGRLLDRLGRHDEGLSAIVAAKRAFLAASGHGYDAARAEQDARTARAFWTAETMALMPRAALRADRPQPIFIVGAPRSGTTLMEQSLGRLDAVDTGGEMIHLAEIAHRSGGLLGNGLAYPASLTELFMAGGAADVALLRDRYLELVAAEGGGRTRALGVRFVTDKRNANEWYLPLITLLFPASPVIRMVRHPLDAVLSVFSHVMDYGYRQASDLVSAARHYALVASLVDELLGRFPHRVLTVRYEDVVADQETTMRRVLSHVGEPFDERVLSFEHNRRYAHTESRAQVAEPLYRRAVFRYKNVRDRLDEIVPILDPVINRLGYET